MFLPISTLTTIQALLISGSLGLPWDNNPTSPFQSTSGFTNPTFSTSKGGYATCLSGYIAVHPTATNEKILFSEPKNQYEATASFVHFGQVSSNQSVEVNGGPTTVSSRFNIAAKLCYPQNWSPSSSQTLQFLTHGIGFNQSYWDFAEGYSFIDVAAKAGYPTFSHDRLGVGASDHPDPIQIVQSPLQVEIVHLLVALLRSGKVAGQSFAKIVGVGHSFGSIVSVGLLAKYPTDFDGVVLTGFSTNPNALGLTFADFDPVIANQNQPARFGGLPNGYLVVNSPAGNQFAFFYYPNFDVKIFLADDASKQTFTYGELFTLTSVIAPSSFTGPVDAVIGEFDWIFAQGNAYVPTQPGDPNQAAAVQPALFPNASKGSESYIVPGAGHAINLHYSAEQMFDQVQAFMKNNGF